VARPKEGSPAPDFVLTSDTGEKVRLSDLRGRPVVLYFYPKDDTPGCTKEACGFRDDYARYARAGVAILGVSPDTPGSHTAFKEKFHLPFPLLADEDKKVLKQYGVWGKKKFMGREYMGVLRTTFLIGRDGKLIRVFEKVKPEGHSQEILAALNE
jgi:thioredoxin-dependent peroxiredoxin